MYHPATSSPLFFTKLRDSRSKLGCTCFVLLCFLGAFLLVFELLRLKHCRTSLVGSFVSENLPGLRVVSCEHFT